MKVNSNKDRIISVSRRTDVIAHYFNWFKDRVGEGRVTVVNPFNRNQARVISLLPEDVDVIVFWTRNPRPLLEDVEFFKFLQEAYHFYFLFTITGYPRILEPSLPPFSETIDSFIKLSKCLEFGSVVWRYDPIIISSKTGFSYHKDKFAQIASLLRGNTNRVIISIVDPYPKTVKRLHRVGIDFRRREELVKDRNFQDFLSFLIDCSHQNGMEIRTCCENFAQFGIRAGSCIDNELINSLFGLNFQGKRDKFQRKNCRCIESVDIGSYNSCIYECQYCYAVRDVEKAKENYLKGFFYV